MPAKLMLAEPPVNVKLFTCPPSPFELPAVKVITALFVPPKPSVTV
jgi:hypothetical protein